jgi:thiol:disulfide interchange protein DsbD
MNDNLLAQFTISYTASLFMGVTAGMGQCSIACAPFLSTYIMGSGNGFLNGFKSFAVFAMGRLVMCAALGLAAGYIGTAFIDVDFHSVYLSKIFDVVMIVIGLLMLIRPVCVTCKKSNKENEDLGLFSRLFISSSTTHLFIMGMAFAAIPCPPMGAMLLYSLQMPSMLSGSIIMLLFAIGSAVSPLIIISALAGLFSKKIKAEAPQHRMLFQRLSGFILIILVGFSVIF